jgi:gliding motility-associated-like protein
MATDSITVTQPATPLSASITNIVNVLCYGDATGSVTATASGGTSPYQFSIDSITFQSSGTFNGLTAGIYSMFVIDANGCDTTISFTITQPDSVLTVEIETYNDILCAGQSNGSATALASGGTPPYTFSWNTVPVQNTATATGLTAGTYTVTVDDANNCGPVTATVTIEEPLPITANASALPILCHGDSTMVTIIASGGTGPLVYTFNGVTQTGNGVFPGIPAGNYNWSVTDSLGCGPVTGTLQVTEPDSIDATIAVTTPIACAGGTATVTITATGGTAPYTFIFNGVTQTGSGVFAGIPAGNGYLWSVTDANGCSSVAGSYDISEPDTLEATAVETTPVPCVGGTATVTIFATGGTPPYTYTLNGITQVGNGIFTGVPAGAGLAWSITDANGCGPVSGTIDITEPPIPAASASVTIPIPCVGGTATVSIIASSGVEPYTFTFNGVTQVGNGVFTGILAGSYSWSVTDANGCGPVTGTLNVAAPPVPAASAAVTTPIPCNGGTATVTITAVNGVAPYTYTFNGVTQIGNGIFAGIPAGTGYIWTVYDANGCGPVTDTIDVTEPDPITAIAAVTMPVPCIGATATVTITAYGGTPPYTYTFNGITQPGNGVFTGISAGSYTWSVTDANNCDPYSDTINITEPSIPQASASYIPILCNGETTTVTISASSGVAPYTYTFNGVTQVGDSLFTGIPAGTGYIWTVYDANGCGPVTDTLDINEPLPISAMAAITSPVICIGSTATVTINASGGTAPYTFTLNGVSQVNNGIFTGILAGTYTWSVTDVNNCDPATGTITIDEPPIPAATAYISSPVPCNGGTAIVTISANNGTSPYTYTFNGVTQVGDSIFSGIPAGTGYVWTVYDANGCGPVTGVIDVFEPDVLTATITDQSNHICVGDSTGYATVTPSGGTPGYTYLWNTVPPQTTQTAINLPAGTFSVIVTDTNGCTATTSATITEIEAIEANAGPNQLLCNADVTFLVGNDPLPGIGSWTLISGPNNPTIFPPTGSVAVVAGLIPSPIPYVFSYSIDNEGCVRSDTMTVTNFNPPTPAYAGIDQEFCSSTGNESAVLTGNIPVFGAGLWTQVDGPSIAVISDPSLPTTTVSDLNYGTYAFQWTISNGICQVTDDVVNVTITAPATAYAGDDDTICEGNSITLSSSMAANFTTLFWTTSGTGVFNDPTILNPVYTPSVTDVLNGTVALTLTAGANEPCEDVLDQMILTIIPQPVVNAGEDASTCQNMPYTVSGAEVQNCSSFGWTTTGSGTLTNANTLTPTYTPAVGESGIIYLIIYGTGNSSCGSASDTMALQVCSPAIAYAGQDETVCGSLPVTLGTSFANYYSSLLWTTSGTGFFNDPSMLHPVYTPSTTDILNGTVALTLTAYGLAPCGNASDQMILTLIGSPEVNAGPDGQTCQDLPFTVSGAEVMNCESFIWTTTGAGILADETTLTPTYTPAASESGVIYLILTGTGYSSCGSDADTMLLEINLPAVVDAGPDDAICQGDTYHITGSSASNYTTLNWSTSGTGTFDDNEILDPVYTPSPNDLNDGFVYLTLTAGANTSCPDAADDMKLVLNKPALVNAGPDASVCSGESFTVSEASAQIFTSLVWTTDGYGTITDPTTLTPTYVPFIGETGNITLTLTATSSECGAVSDEMVLTINTTATASAGPDISTCDVTPIQITDATALDYTTLLWTSNGSGSFDNPTALNPVYTPSSADVNIGMVVLTLKATGIGGCGDTTDQVILTMEHLPVADAGTNATICQGSSYTVSGASATSYSAVQWSIVPASGGTLTDETTLTPTFTPAADFSGIATLILNVQGESTCGSSIISDEMYVTVNERPVISAGPDQTIYPGATAHLNGTASGASGFYGWNWTPADMIINPSVSSPTTVSLYSETTFTLSVIDLATGCVSSDNIIVFVSETGGGIRAVADFDTTLVNTPTVIPVIDNDINPEELPLSVNFCSFPAHGIVIINSDNTITYSPYPEFEGDDSFCYQICTTEQPVMCSDTVVYIHVKQPDISDLFIFNGISPNGDGNNDFWKIKGIENYPDNKVTIYNRWGDVIRKISGYNNSTRSWDGTNEDGKLMPNGTYFYVLEIKDMGIRKGWILIRGEE